MVQEVVEATHVPAGDTMVLIISKPIMWNTKGYQRPSGVKVSANSYPGQHGFGHEEWNGSDALEFEEDGVGYRAFHTEGVGNLPVREEAGHTFVFLYASHDRKQELVGVAGNATCLINDERQRKEITKQLELDKLGDQAWAIPRVQALHENDRRKFDKAWQADLAWIPNWKCPSDMFLWLKEPALLDARKIRGEGKLLTMFSRYTPLDASEALHMLDSVSARSRSPAWHRIRAEINSETKIEASAEIDGREKTLYQDLLELDGRANLNSTTRQALINARLGQGKFRREVELIWDESCSVSGCGVREVLRASHIKPWNQSSDDERLDRDNGLLLTADLDALFDSGLISFSDDGEMMVSRRLAASNWKFFRLKRPLRKRPNDSQRLYLAYHRQSWGFDSV